MLDDIRLAAVGGDDEGRLSELVAAVDLGALPHQQLHHVGAAGGAGRVQRPRPLAVLVVDLGLVVDSSM